MIPLMTALESNSGSKSDRAFEEEFISTLDGSFDFDEIVAHGAQIASSPIKVIDPQQLSTIKQDIIYEKATYYREKNTARLLIQLDSNHRELHPLAKFRENPSEALELLDPETRDMLSSDQKNAVLQSVLHKVLIITGGPGSDLLFFSFSFSSFSDNDPLKELERQRR